MKSSEDTSSKKKKSKSRTGSTATDSVADPVVSAPSDDDGPESKKNS